MKKPMLLLVLLALTISAGAETPYEVFGHKGKTLETTLEKGGGIIELINTDTTSEVGRLLFDFKNMQYTAYGRDNCEIARGKILPTVSKGWWSRDPKAAKYPGWSPYNMVLSNPINNIDPNGQDVFVIGEDAEKTVNEMDKASILDIKLNLGDITQEKYKLNIGFPENQEAYKYFTPMDFVLSIAANDPSIRVELYATKAEVYIAKDDLNAYPVSIGAYEGSTIIQTSPSTIDLISAESVEEKNTVVTLQLFNFDQSEKIQKAEMSTIASDATHEILESYYGALLNPGGNYNTGYLNAHQAANHLEKNPPNFSVERNQATGEVYAQDILNPNFLGPPKRVTLIQNFNVSRLNNNRIFRKKRN